MKTTIHPPHSPIPRFARNGSLTLIFIGIIAILTVVGVLVFRNPEKKEKPMVEKILEDKKIAMIIAFKDFRDEEYFVPKEILEKAGAEIKTVSTQIGEAIGADGEGVEVDLLIESLNAADFDGIIFIGGPGALKYLDNEDSYRVAREMISQNKILAAICISPVILARAKALEGKKATVWTSALDRGAVKTLKNYGAVYQEESVVIDGKIVTANGPEVAKKFGEAIVDLLK